MLVENYYISRVRQTRQPLINNIQSQLPQDAVLPIKFKLYNLSISGWDSEDNDVPMIVIPNPKVLRAQETITEVSRAELLSDRSASTVLMYEVLSRMDVPEDERTVIIENIFQVLESANTMLPICVDIKRVTCRLQYMRDRSDQMIPRVTNESMDTYEVRPIPAAKSFIKDLERVGLDDSEDVKESCVICMECFEGGVQAIRLPCSHIFHENCSVQWLMTSHLCPLCRYPMPCEEDLLGH
ncbi:RING finger protein 150 [Rosa chinensis]|nr:RING finger protein 150 [Rosa chinensis]